MSLVFESSTTSTLLFDPKSISFDNLFDDTPSPPVKPIGSILYFSVSITSLFLSPSSSYPTVTLIFLSSFPCAVLGGPEPRKAYAPRDSTCFRYADDSKSLIPVFARFGSSPTVSVSSNISTLYPDDFESSMSHTSTLYESTSTTDDRISSNVDSPNRPGSTLLTSRRYSRSRVRLYRSKFNFPIISRNAFNQLINTLRFPSGHIVVIFPDDDTNSIPRLFPGSPPFDASRTPTILRKFISPFALF